MSNDFIPFAVGGSANVTAQATYAANTTLTQNGFQAGIAKSPDLNKVWRQSSIMSAVLAQFIANTTGQNAVDDGTTATLLANLIAAVSAQSESIIGGVRNLVMSVTTASATATLTADEIIVGSALGGLKYTLANFSKTINLATTGAGGMDTGTAPVSGYVALYAIWNPTTATAALLAQNASTLRSNVYSGANMPAGYTASALVGVWPTNASSQFVAGNQFDRVVSFAPVTMLNTSTQAASYTSLSLGGAIPANAKTCRGTMSVTSSTGSVGCFWRVSGSSTGVGEYLTSTNSSAAINSGIQTGFTHIPLLTPQSLFYIATVTGGTMNATIQLSEYTF